MGENAIFETIEEMTRRLRDTSGGAQARAVAEAIKAIKAS